MVLRIANTELGVKTLNQSVGMMAKVWAPRDLGRVKAGKGQRKGRALWTLSEHEFAVVMLSGAYQ